MSMIDITLYENDIYEYLEKSINTQMPYLGIESEHLEEIPNLIGFKWITSLNLTNNKISKLDKYMFPPKLIKLNLSSCTTSESVPEEKNLI